MSWSEKISAGDWPATIQSVAETVVIAVFAVTFLVQAFTIPSESMEQTLLIGDYLLVDKFCYGGSTGWNRLLPYRNIRRGDVIVFHYPVNPAQDFVKRVVALPGDRLRLINKRVYVNSVPLVEPYTQYKDVYKRQLQQSGPHNGRLLLNAERRLAAGDPETAQKLAQQALDAQEEDSGRALFILAEVATANRDMDGARTYFERALQTAHEPKVIAWSHIYLGRIFDLKEDRLAAVDQYRAALDAAGGALPEAKVAAQRGLDQPYEPPVAKRPE